MKQTVTLLALLLAMAAYPAYATDSLQPVLHLNLKEAVSMALERNNLIKAAGHRAEAARQGIAVAGSRYYPSLFFDETFMASNAPTQVFMMKLDEGRFTQNDFQTNNLNHPATQHDFKTALTINQPLYVPSIAHAREMAVKETEKQDEGLEATRQDIAFQVFRLYLEVQKARAHLQATDLAVQDARESLRLATVRNEAGVGLRSDELRARTHLASIEQHLITAHNDLTLATMHMANTVGLKEGQAVDIAEPAGALAWEGTPEHLTQIAVESRTELKQYRADLGKKESGVKLATSAYLPTLAAFASYQLNARDTAFGADNDAWMAGVNLKWELFDGLRRNDEKKRAVAERAAAAEQVEAVTRDITLQVRESVMRFAESDKRREVARHAVKDAEETVRLLTRRFENSLATMFELLDAQNALNQTRASLVESEANFVLAGGRVYYATGTFLKEILK